MKDVFWPSATCHHGQLLADFCLFSTEGIFDNVRIQEVFHSVCGSELLADRQRADI